MTDFEKKLIKERMNLDWNKIENMSSTESYLYLINEYIPSQGETDMKAFIDFEFSTTTYLLWKLAKHEIVSIPLQKAIKKIIIKVYNKYPGEAEAIS